MDINGDVEVIQAQEDSDSDDSEDDIHVELHSAGPTSFQISKSSKPEKDATSKDGTQETEKLKGIDLDTLGDINGTPVMEVDLDALPEKPWRMKGVNPSEFFNYGFNEET